MNNILPAKRYKLGHGMYGTCYKIKGDKVLKVYNNKKNFPKNQLSTLGIKNDTYYFAEEIIYDNDKPIATIMPYAKGVPFIKDMGNCYEQNCNPKINNLSKGIEQLYKDTDILSNEHSISIADFYPQNILFDEVNHKYNAIDTDTYKVMDKVLTSIIAGRNIKSVNEGLLECVFPYADEEEPLTNFIENHKIIKELYDQTLNSSNDNKTFKYLLKEIKKELENIQEYEIDNLYELSDSVINYGKVRR